MRASAHYPRNGRHSPQVGIGHHLPALRRREPLPRDRHRLLQPAPGGLVDRRPHAHRSRLRRATRRRPAVRDPARRGLPQTTERHTARKTTLNFAASPASLARWARWGPAPTTPSPSSSTPPSSARRCKARPAGTLPLRHGSRCLPGSPVTPPAADTATAASRAPAPTRKPARPLRCISRCRYPF